MDLALFHPNGGLIKTNLPLPLLAMGKVRDVYDMAMDLLFVTTDRISSFDVVLPTPIPGKGRCLTQISAFWFDFLSEIIPNHLTTVEMDEFPAELQPFAEILAGRSMLVKKCTPLPIESIVRGYLVGSGWKDYQMSGMVCGHALPPGLVDGSRLTTPLFTPSTKAEQGQHDVNITVAQAFELLGSGLGEQVAAASAELYSQARDYAVDKGIIIADTKFEFGLGADERLVLIDEVLTPDSSRFWPADQYQPGQSQPSFDKQYVRDWLTKESGWDKASPPPELPEEVVAGTQERYREVMLRLTGREF